MFLYSNFKIVTVYIITLTAIFCIPSYFVLTNIIFAEKIKSIDEILQWVDINEKKIFEQKSFYMLKSVKFKINIYNEKKELLFGNIKNFSNLDDFKIYSKYPNIYYQKKIKSDKSIFYMIVEAPLNCSKIFFLTAILFLIMPFAVFFISNLFEKSMIYPYKKMQDFFNNTMHELKTPLGIIKINLELMNENLQNSKYIQRIKSSVKQIQISYENIEYYIKHKKLSHEKEIIDFSKFLEDRIVFFEDIAASKSIKITYFIKLEIFIYINKAELQRLIDSNIINAIKCSFSKGSIKIILHKNKDGKGEFSVQNCEEKTKNTKNTLERFKRKNAIECGFELELDMIKNICAKNDIAIDVKSAGDRSFVSTYIFKQKNY
ncbi:MAG: HAMP domain-containing histidine kinase [Campylobacteraceae bacterium]|jgi:hypothetical protein|nr:HAMP domain-containing histidine kinase [Campylobacteraceae bacterium]